MIKEVIMYTVVCNNCRRDIGTDAEYSGYSDRNSAEDIAMESDWMKEGEKHYCPDCYSYDDNDKFVIGKNISLWSEGYAANQERGYATLMGTFKATDIDDAVRQYIAANPVSGKLVQWDRYGRGQHAIWGCRIFDNEIDARKSFG